MSNELSTEEGFAFIDSLGKYNGLVLVFSGGEPLVRSDIHLLIERAAENGLRPVMGTNGVLLNKLAPTLSRAGLMKAGISLDSPRPEVHDRFRGVPGAFNRAMDGIRSLHEHSIGTQIHTTVSDKNINDLGQMVDLAESTGSDALHVFFMVPTGRASTLQQMSIAQYEGLLEQLYNLQRESSIQIKPVCAPQYLRIFSQRLEEEQDLLGKFQKHGHFTTFKRGCLAGITYARIDPCGDVTPCPYLGYIVGSIRERPFPEIWDCSEVLAAFRNGGLIQDKCAECDYLDMCGGGCRARAYAVSGELNGTATWCSYLPEEAAGGN